jgi:membrane protease YdiL (CAAX protease family)
VTFVGIALALFGPWALAILGERGRPGPRPRVVELLAGEAVYLALIGAVLWIAFTRDGLTAEALGFRVPTWRAFAWGAALSIFFTRVYGPLLYLAMRALGVRTFEGGIAKLAGLPFWYLVLAVVIGGTAEEILYRGYAIARIETLTGSVWLAALAPMVIFSLAHVPLWGLAPALSTFLAAGVFTAFFLWQRDLTPVVIAHVVTDLVGIVLARRARPSQKAN